MLGAAAAARGAAVDGDELADHVAVADDERGPAAPRNFRSCGTSPMEVDGEDLVAVANLGPRRRRRTDAPMRLWRPMRDALADGGVRCDDRRSRRRSPRRGMDDGGWVESSRRAGRQAPAPARAP